MTAEENKQLAKLVTYLLETTIVLTAFFIASSNSALL